MKPLAGQSAGRRGSDNMKSLFALIAVCVAGACAGPTGWEADEYQRTPLGDAIDKASLKMLKEVYESGSDKSVVTSPLGLMILLALYGDGAGTGTQEQIRAFLGGSDQRQVTKSFSELSEAFANMNPEYLTLANKVCVSKGLTLADPFKKTALAYQSSLDSLDFSKPQEAADFINKWASEKTRGNIKTPVDPSLLTPDTVAALINVIYFQGHWHVPFNASETKDEDFHVDKNKTVKKPTMRLTQPLHYAESKAIGARMIELPYKETGFRMVIVLPDEVDGLSKVVEKVAEKGLLDDVFQLFPSGRDINLFLPKFDIRTKLDLNDILEKVGVSKIFSEPATGIVKDSSVVVSKAFQEAFIKVNEEGAEAGAVTGAVAVLLSLPSRPPRKLDFKVDRPFLFAILHEDKVLFAGTYSH